MALIFLAGFLAAVAWLIVFSCGVVITWRGLRGKRVDEHPRCRRCGYILVGATQLPQRCAECGSVLGGPRTIRRSPRRRRWSAVFCGSVTMLLCVGLLGLPYVFPSSQSAAPVGPGLARPLAAARVPQRPVQRLPRPYWESNNGFEILSLTNPVAPGCPEIWGGDEGNEVIADEAEPAGVPGLADDPQWYELRNIAGCCPHCGYPVMSPSPSPLCPRCGENLAR